MKKSVIIILTCLAIGAAELGFSKVPKNQRAAIDRILAALDSETLIIDYATEASNQMRAQLEASGVNQADQLTAILTEVFAETLREEIVDSKALKKLNYRLWSEAFDLSELERLADFYESDLGRRLANESPKISTEVASFVMENTEQLGATIQRKLVSALINAKIQPPEAMRDQHISLDDDYIPGEPELQYMTEQTCGEYNDSSTPLPVFRAPPTYPHLAASHAIEGWVELEFSVLADGTTQNIRVQNSSTGTLFDAAAVAAVGEYRYCPGFLTHGQEIRIVFQMEK